MGFSVLTFLIVFLVVGSGSLLLFYREPMLKRVSAVVAPHGGTKSVRQSARQTGATISRVVENMGRILPKSPEEVSVAQQRLIRAGYRNEFAIRLFYGAKVAIPLLLCLLLLATSLVSDNYFFAYIAALGLGFLVPDFWVDRQIRMRQKQIRIGLPDMLDLMVICVEAGLSLDQATARIAVELHMSRPVISDELGVVSLEQRAGRSRTDSWKQFVDRTGVDSVRNLVTVLMQSEQLGTGVAKMLRVHADTLRTQRRQNVEEQAAKTSVKLVFPLVLLIFPSLFLVVMGPALIIMSESFKKYLD